MPLRAGPVQANRDRPGNGTHRRLLRSIRVVPSPVGEIFAAVSVARTGFVSWNTRVPPPSTSIDTGVYVVALTDELNSLESARPVCPLSKAALVELLEARRELNLDRARPDAERLGERLASFWCPDEVIIYIGSAGPRQRIKVSALSDRVAEYYSTPLGARSPHAGGWPLKTLSNLSDLYVHYAYCGDVLTKERLMLKTFADGLSTETRSALHDATAVMPFANLRDADGVRKAHGIKGARAPQLRSRSLRRSAAARVTVDRSDATPATSAPPARDTASGCYTQRVSAGDIRQGIIRISRPVKSLFPSERARVEIDLRGERKSCRWDPRHGPDHERSGVLGVGTALTRGLVTEGERLSIWVANGVFYLG